MGKPEKATPTEAKPKSNVTLETKSENLTTGNFKDFLDQNSEQLTSILSKLSLSEQQNEEIKQLLNEELKTSVSDMKIELTKESQEIKKDFLTIFGLFASFVTFLSIEVQVFKNKDNVMELIGITSVSLAFVMFFALVINDISKDKSQWSDFKKPTYILNMAFAVVGMTFLYLGATCSINKVDKIINAAKKDSIKIVNLEKEIKELKKIKTVSPRNPTQTHP